jgi:peptidoglycan/LPS O-acetylase OafA/YrhL
MSAAIPLSTEKPAQRVVSDVHVHLRALDGIRFIAAFCVLAGHGYWYVVLQQQGTVETLDAISLAIGGLPELGMTLFFVLSGFVIHYNYHRSVGIGATGNGDFFIARFARLYPLFLAVFAIDFVQLLWVEGYFSGTPLNNFDLFGPLPFFLSFTQAWLFIPFDGTNIAAHYGSLIGQVQATGAMWSLSVEFLFYLIYPLFSVWLTRRAGRSLALFAAITAAAGLLYYIGLASHRAAVEALGVQIYGSPKQATGFAAWLLFYAPFGRISEFLLGAAAAQYYLSRHYLSRPAGWDRRLPAWSTWIAALAILGWSATAAIVTTGSMRLVYTSIIAAPIAGFVLLSIIRPAGASRLLASPLLVKGGEASYSLYLLHFYTMHEWAKPWAGERSMTWRVVIYLVGLAVSLALARTVYLGFERPARSWLRRHCHSLRLNVVLGWLFVAILLFSVIASLHIHAAGKIAF